MYFLRNLVVVVMLGLFAVSSALGVLLIKLMLINLLIHIWWLKNWRAMEIQML